MKRLHNNKYFTSILIQFLFCLLFLVACRKHHTDSNGLPPATQEGKNTLGFLLNGQPWTPQGFAGSANLSMNYDPSFSCGVFNIGTYRITNSTNGEFQSLHLFGDSIQNAQKIILPNNTKFGFSFSDQSTHCEYSTSDSSTILISGYFDLKKLDKINHVFSGEFELSFKKMDVKIFKSHKEDLI
jgi:hypothetical protein